MRAADCCPDCCHSPSYAHPPTRAKCAACRATLAAEIDAIHRDALAASPAAFAEPAGRLDDFVPTNRRRLMPELVPGGRPRLHAVVAGGSPPVAVEAAPVAAPPAKPLHERLSRG